MTKSLSKKNPIKTNDRLFTSNEMRDIIKWVRVYLMSSDSFWECQNCLWLWHSIRARRKHGKPSKCPKCNSINIMLVWESTKKLLENLVVR